MRINILKTLMWTGKNNSMRKRIHYEKRQTEKNHGLDFSSKQRKKGIKHHRYFPQLSTNSNWTVSQRNTHDCLTLTENRRKWACRQWNSNVQWKIGLFMMNWCARNRWSYLRLRQLTMHCILIEMWLKILTPAIKKDSFMDDDMWNRKKWKGNIN